MHKNGFPKYIFKVSKNNIRYNIRTYFKTFDGLFVSKENASKMNAYFQYLQVKAHVKKAKLYYYIVSFFDEDIITNAEEWNGDHLRPIFQNRFYGYPKYIQDDVKRELYKCVEESLCYAFLEVLGFKNFSNIPYVTSFTYFKQELKNRFLYSRPSLATTILNELTENDDAIINSSQQANADISKVKIETLDSSKKVSLLAIKNFIEKTKNVRELRLLDAYILFLFANNTKAIEKNDLLDFARKYCQDFVNINSALSITVTEWLEKCDISFENSLSETDKESISLHFDSPIYSSLKKVTDASKIEWTVEFLQQPYEFSDLNPLKPDEKPLELPDLTVRYCNRCNCDHFMGTHIFTKFKNGYADEVNSIYVDSQYTVKARGWIITHDSNIRLTRIEVLDGLFGGRYISRKRVPMHILNQESSYARLPYSNIQNPRSYKAGFRGRYENTTQPISYGAHFNADYYDDGTVKDMSINTAYKKDETRPLASFSKRNPNHPISLPYKEDIINSSLKFSDSNSLKNQQLKSSISLDISEDNNNYVPNGNRNQQKDNNDSGENSTLSPVLNNKGIDTSDKTINSREHGCVDRSFLLANNANNTTEHIADRENNSVENLRRFPPNEGNESIHNGNTWEQEIDNLKKGSNLDSQSICNNTSTSLYVQEQNKSSYVKQEDPCIKNKKADTSTTHHIENSNIMMATPLAIQKRSFILVDLGDDDSSHKLPVKFPKSEPLN